MKVIIIFTCFLLALSSYVQAGYNSNCDIEGWKDENYGTFTFKVPIEDTHRGVIATFQTKNVLRMKVQDLSYLNATWEDQTLTFYTSDHFENYEKLTGYTKNPVISVVIHAICTEDTTQKMTFKQPVLDTNNHFPILSRKRYDYDLGMTVPKDLKLTNILPITATEYDITNAGVSFTIEENDYFKIDTNGKQFSGTKVYKTTLTAQKDITAPYKQTFNLVVTDDGHPQLNVSVPLTITVSTPEELEQNQAENADEVQVKQETMIHPPVFEKHLYFADYSSSYEFKMEEPIVIKYGAESYTQLKQKGYETYFKVQFEDSSNEIVIINKLTSLPDEIIQSTNAITIELEAVNEGLLHMPGRTAILIRLPSLSRSSTGDSKECDLTINHGNSSSGSTFSLVLFLLAVFCIVFINIFVAIMFVSKTRVRFQRV